MPPFTMDSAAPKDAPWRINAVLSFEILRDGVFNHITVL